MLPNDILDRIHTDIELDLKDKGKFDEMMVKLLESIYGTEKFEACLEMFKNECIRFCENHKGLLENKRDQVRKSFRDRFYDTNYSTSRRKVQDYIRQFLTNESRETLRQEYIKLAAPYLMNKYTNNKNDEAIDMDLDSDKEEDQKPEVKLKVEQDDDNVDQEMSVEDEEIQAPEFSPISEGNSVENDFIRSEIKSEANSPKSVDQVSLTINNLELDSSNVITDLDLSDVSSVSTDELEVSDYEDILILSPNEAAILDKPPGCKIKVNEINEAIKCLDPAKHNNPPSILPSNKRKQSDVKTTSTTKSDIRHLSNSKTKSNSGTNPDNNKSPSDVKPMIVNDASATADITTNRSSSLLQPTRNRIKKPNSRYNSEYYAK